ncbi:MAG: hypothetical protein QMD50_02260 [Patescibacteria group bacterium]|nr:hypothetical protein [Patescibacteria group bacterium]
MAQDFFSQQKWPDQNKPLGTGEGESPLTNPPLASPKVEVRTMASDLKSTQESGGGAPHPYTPPPPPPIKTQTSNTPPPEPQSPKLEQKPIDRKPSDAIFRPPEVPATPAPTIISKTPSPQEQKPKKKILLWIILAVVIIGIIALGYFVLYPMFFPKNPVVVENPTPTPTPTPAPTPEPTPTPTPIPIEIQPTPEALIIHTSLFKTPADLTTEISLPSLSLQDLKSLIEFATTDVPVLKEIVLKDSENKIIPLNKITPFLLPNILDDSLLISLNFDFTYFTYTNNKGTWPGIIISTETSDEPALTDLKTKINAAIEKSGAPITNLFLTDPGTSSTWKDGKVNNYKARYIGFSKTEAALSYTWINNQFLLISTNYAGAQAAAKLLGF